GAIVGRLLNSATNQPESGVQVRLLDEDGNVIMSVLTDEAGYYHLVPPVEGEYVIQVVRTSEDGDIEETVEVEVVDKTVTAGPRVVQGQLVRLDRASNTYVP